MGAQFSQCCADGGDGSEVAVGRETRGEAPTRMRRNAPSRLDVARVRMEEDNGARKQQKPPSPPCAIPGTSTSTGAKDLLGYGKRRHSDITSLTQYRQQVQEGSNGARRAELLATHSERIPVFTNQRENMEQVEEALCLSPDVCNDGSGGACVLSGGGLRRSGTVENGLNGLIENGYSDDEEEEKEEFKSNVEFKRGRGTINTPVICTPCSFGTCSFSSVQSASKEVGPSSTHATPELLPESEPVNVVSRHIAESKLAAALRAVSPSPLQRKEANLVSRKHLEPSTKKHSSSTAVRKTAIAPSPFSTDLPLSNNPRGFALQRRKEMQRKWENVALMCT